MAHLAEKTAAILGGKVALRREASGRQARRRGCWVPIWGAPAPGPTIRPGRCRPRPSPRYSSAPSDGSSQASSSISFSEGDPRVVDTVSMDTVLSLDKMQAKETPSTSSGVEECADVSWSSWVDYFDETDVLKESMQDLAIELEEAVARENFGEAAKLKRELERIAHKDAVKNVAEELESAVAEERFSDAAKCRDEGLVGLQGWWVARTSDDPAGKVVYIQPSFGRYVGKAYTAKDLAEGCGFTTERNLASLLPEDPPMPLEEAGVPVLEVFLKEDTGGRRQHRACALRSRSPQENPDGSLSLGDVGESLVVESEKDDDGNILRMSVTFVKKKEAVNVDQEAGRDVASTSGYGDLDSEATSSASHPEADLLLMDPALQAVRIPAEVRWKDKDHFSVFVNKDATKAGLERPEGEELQELQGSVSEGLNKGIELQIAGSKTTSLGDIISSEAISSADVLDELIAAVKKMHLAKTGNNLMVDEAQVVSALGHLIGGNEFDVHAVTKVAQLLLTNMEQSLMLEGEVMFSRIVREHAKTDPFCGLYLGSFGPHGPELLLLQRALWDDGEECIKAIKLTGDVNVPAGEVSFRVKVGRKHRLESRGVYPEELGIIARYKGQGRVAEQGFREAHWVDGELLQFASGSQRLTGGAQLGFVWALPGTRRFLILLNRITLPDL